MVSRAQQRQGEREGAKAVDGEPSRARACSASRTTRAVILSAGRGTRMGAGSRERAKALTPLLGRAMLDRQLQALDEAGFLHVTVVIGHLGDQIERALVSWRREAHAQRRARLPPRVDTVRQQPTPLSTNAGVAHGTAHALGSAASALSGEAFLLLLGDVLPGAGALARIRRRAVGCDAVVAVDRHGDVTRGAAVHWDERSGTLRAIVEKPRDGEATSSWNNSGVYLLPAGSARLCAALVPSPRGELELPDLVSRLIDDGLDVRVAPIERPLHVGTPEELRLAERVLSRPAALRPGPEIDR
ncbi:MAG: nucleotidyltransferase family protein [Acidobacteria bacterium]|nr:MAG: nucleotidyltransferase family protein [Acidobacteriota bacterium]REK07351.1 MAG: nucleotidyltransferase family protein [Acidobacteriota bacterium]